MPDLMEQNKKHSELLDQALTGLWTLVNASADKIRSLKEEIALLKSDGAGSAEILKSNDATIAALSGTITELEDSLLYMQERLDTKEHEIVLLKDSSAQAEKLLREKEEFIAAMEMDISSLIEKNSALKEETEGIGNIEAELAVMKEMLAHKNLLLDEAEGREAAAGKQAAAFREEIARREEVISELKSNYNLELHAAIEEKENLEREVRLLNDAISAKATLIEEMEGKMGKMADSDKAKDAYMMEISAKDELIAELTRKVQGLSSELNEITARQPELIKENFELTGSIAKLKSENEQHLQEIKHYQKIETDLVRKEKEVERLKEEIESLEKKLERSNQQELFAFFDERPAIGDAASSEAEASFRLKNEELEKLLKTRYEQIEILESDLNRLIDSRHNDEKTRRELADMLESYLLKLEKIIEN